MSVVFEDDGNVTTSETSTLHERASTGTTTVNDILPRRGMPRHALDEIAVDAANERRRDQDRWGT